MKEIKEFIELLAKESGNIIKKYYRTNVSIETKSDASPVTIADKETEEKIRELIMKHFPEHGILGEEFEEHNPNAEYKWIIDPIDGTKSFITGIPLFTTLIALTYRNEPIWGAIHQPILNELMIGNNQTTTFNGNIVKVRNLTNLEECTLLSTDMNNFKIYHNIEKFLKLTEKVKIYRTWGDGYGYLLLSAGYADIMIDPIMNIWDVMAVIPVVRGACGIITDYYGNTETNWENVIACNNKELLHEIVKILHR
ncbi:MAG TPA: inositol monophosphatase family protein [Ignavibacteriales bacterium]|nr:inositol monophosphatase family protein [Ignavibacteriales bacterium]HOL80944.1 inositol monophosphatase family protein [Ignavibacteriales bacterium]HPP32725.1 inositol monophosphatase family protein [Ignavibacteriales bacterium]